MMNSVKRRIPTTFRFPVIVALVATLLSMAALSSPAHADEETKLLLDTYSVTYLTTVVNGGGTSTTFNYKVCKLDHDPGRILKHITFKIEECADTALDFISCSTAPACEETTDTEMRDPTDGSGATSLFGVKFDFSSGDNALLFDGPEDVGYCHSLSFTYAGSIRPESQIVGVKAMAPFDVDFDIESLTGPSCDVTSPVPTPTPTSPAGPTASPTPTFTPTSVPSATSTSTPVATATGTATRTPTPTRTPPTGTASGIACTAGDSYLVNCTDTRASVALTGTVINQDADPSATKTWISDCPEGSITGGDTLTPTLTFATSTLVGLVPNTCKVLLMVGDAMCSAQVSSTPCKLDCKGTIGGTASFDRCGVCGGDGLSCTSCSSTSAKDSIAALDGAADRQLALVLQATRRLKKVNRSAARRLSKEARDLYNEQWTLLWTTLPVIVTDCKNNSLCTSVSNEPQLATYEKGAKQQFQLLRRAVKTLRRADKSRAKFCTTLLKLGKKARSNAVSESKAFPLSSDNC